jgi:hypothetical protein
MTSPAPALCGILPGSTGKVKEIPKEVKRNGVPERKPARAGRKRIKVCIYNDRHSQKYALYSKKISQIIILKYFR